MRQMKELIFTHPEPYVSPNFSFGEILSAMGPTYRQFIKPASCTNSPTFHILTNGEENASWVGEDGCKWIGVRCTRTSHVVKLGL